MDYQMVTWPMTSRDPRRCCEAVRSAILATACVLMRECAVLCCQLLYQCARSCGYVLMNNGTQLARCVAGRRQIDDRNLLIAPCSVVTTAELRPGDRLRLQDVNTANNQARYVMVPSTAAETAATNFWGVVKLGDINN